MGREAVRRFIEKAFHNESVCNTRKVGEDFQLGLFEKNILSFVCAQILSTVRIHTTSALFL